MKTKRDMNTNALKAIQSAGTTPYNSRYNCNEYVLDLGFKHQFSQKTVPNQPTVNIISANYNAIRSTVSNEYRNDFDRGFQK